MSDNELDAMPYPHKRPLPDVALLTDEELGQWTAQNDQMAWGQSMIPTHLVIAFVRSIRDRYEAALAAERKGKP